MALDDLTMATSFASKKARDRQAKTLHALRVALSQPAPSPQPAAPAVPAGFALVPWEPTDAMVQAGVAEMPHFTDEPGPVWSAMLAASQQKGKQ